MTSNPAAPPAATADSQQRCLLLCDLANSTALIERLGDRRAAELIREHDATARALMADFGGQEIDKSDGFLLLFEQPAAAIRFALAYQRDLHQLGQRSGQPLQARIGIHVGELQSWRNADAAIAGGAKPVEVEGLAKAVTARLMALAGPDQILLSESAWRAAQAEPAALDGFAELRWQAHGRYRMKGIAAAVAVYEVGRPGVAPLAVPRDSAKAQRLRPWYRTRGSALAVLVVLLLAWPLWQRLQSGPVLEFAERDWVVLADLRNQTADPKLSEPLQLALRVALEQSRHLNLVSELSQRQALQRMDRRRETTHIDRALGAELAQREGARALIVPSLREVGGKLVLSAELVAPDSRATVHTVQAAAVDVDSLLGSVEQVVRALRIALNESGEALARAQPALPAVTTGDLNALRAFALGRRAYEARRWGEATELYQEARRLDPEFDAAVLGLTALALTQGDVERASALLRGVDPDSPRLSHRDRLYRDAMLAWLEDSPERAAERWQLMRRMYPDDFAAQANFAHVAGDHLFRYDEAEAAFRQTLRPQNPWLGSNMLSLATLHLARGDPAGVADMLQQAEQSGAGPGTSVYLYLPAAQRRWDEAERHFIHLQADDPPSNRFHRHWRRALLQFDRGHWRDAAAALDAAEHASREGPGHWRHDLVLLRALLRPPVDAADWQTLLAGQLDQIETRPPLSQATHYTRAFGLALAALRRGRAEPARWLRQRLSATEFGRGWPQLRQLADVVEAELQLAAGDAHSARRRLEPWRDGRESFQLRVSWLRVLQAQGAQADALNEAEWLAQERGRAWAELAHHGLLLPLNIEASNRALLDAAELALALGDRGRAERHWRLFREQAWPDQPDPALQQRLQQLQSRLEAPPRATGAVGPIAL